MTTSGSVTYELLFGGSMTVFPAIFAALVTGTVYVLRRRSRFLDELDHVSDIERAKYEQLRERIADGVGVLVEDGGAPAEPSAADLQRLVREELDVDQLRSLRQLWKAVGAASEKHAQALDHYETAYKSIALAALACVSIPVVVLVVAVSGGDPFSYSWDLVHVLFGLFAASSLYEGIVHFNEAQRHERALKELQRDAD